MSSIYCGAKPVRQDEHGRMAALASYWALFLIGIPMWWITTSIERHPLPYPAIRALLQQHPKQPPSRQQSSDSVRVKGYPGYQLSFIHISPGSDHCPIDRLSDAYRQHFAPYLATAISQSVAFFKVDLQCRLQAVRADLNDPENLLQSRWNLANSISSLPIITFVIYDAGSGEDGERGGCTNGRSFLYPQWGSVYACSSGSREDDGFEAAMLQFQDHFMRLLGIGSSPDTWYREETRRCAAEAADSLRSLLAVLSANRNMPVPLEVSRSVHHAVGLLQQLGGADAGDGHDSTGRYGTARCALDWAEAAFFHPAMLARQYFPHEHVLAVYVPLLVPLLMPLFVQTLRAVKMGR